MVVRPRAWQVMYPANTNHLLLLSDGSELTRMGLLDMKKAQLFLQPWNQGPEGLLWSSCSSEQLIKDWSTDVQKEKRKSLLWKLNPKSSCRILLHWLLAPQLSRCFFRFPDGPRTVTHPMELRTTPA